MNVGLSREDVLCRSCLTFSINKIASGLRLIWPPSFVRDATGFQTLASLSLRCMPIQQCPSIFDILCIIQCAL